jgi:amino acid transporter
VGHVLFVTSLLAAQVSFHNTAARYAFALGREEVLPAILGRTSARTNAPIFASAVQSAVGLLVIVTYAMAGWDPVVQLFFYAGTIGGIGVLTLLALTSIAVLSFFLKTRHAVGAFSAYLAPMVSSLALFVVVILAIYHLDILLGVPPGHPLTWIVPVTIVATLALGAAWGNHLRVRRPDTYAVIGMGADSAAGRSLNPSTGGIR